MKIWAFFLFPAAVMFAGCGGGGGGDSIETVPVSTAAHSVTPPSKPGLPMSTVFKGESKFHALVARAERENWRRLPLGQRTVKAARAMLGTRYVNYTLEVDDHIESPVVNFNGMDCWTYYENALAFARMLRYKPAPYRPEDMLHMIELERYRGGRCTGSYVSRMHHLEEVFHDNQKRGLAKNVTPGLPGAVRLRREVRYMPESWKSYRYLRNNRDLIPKIDQVEQRVSRLPVYHVPKSRARSVEHLLQDGDICAITTTWKYGYTSHVGLIVRKGNRAYFAHATSDRKKGRRTIIDKPISDYLKESSKHAGMIICRPLDLKPSPMWQKNMANN